jgi:Cu(I)/Ag(I) efflux system protein CusF
MNSSLRSILGPALLAIGASLAAPAFAQVPMTDGEVRKVDKESRKITLRHGEIRNLDMPPMTMVFNVGDAAMLDQVEAGDKIRFRAANAGGAFTIIEIQAVECRPGASADQAGAAGDQRPKTRPFC